MTHSTLHLFRLTPSHISDLQSCITLLKAQDTLVLIDDGSYAASTNEAHTTLNAKDQVYVIKEHALARAVKVHKSVKQISLAELPSLVLTHQNSMTWQ